MFAKSSALLVIVLERFVRRVDLVLEGVLEKAGKAAVWVAMVELIMAAVTAWEWWVTWPSVSLLQGFMTGKERMVSMGGFTETRAGGRRVPM